MYYTLLRLYSDKRLPAENLKKAVTLGWITANDFKTIAGTEYTA